MSLIALLNVWMSSCSRSGPVRMVLWGITSSMDLVLEITMWILLLHCQITMWIIRESKGIYASSITKTKKRIIGEENE